MVRLFYFLILSFSLLVSGETDKSYENRLHNIYLKHYKNPVTQQDWSQLINQLEKSYKLKYKDNLWDLSKTFFKNNLYWSKLWVANPSIGNPHRIYKGNSIHLDLKSLKAVNTSKYSVPIAAQFPGVKLPDQKYQKRSLTENEMPSSLPYIKENLQLEALSSDIDFELRSTPINRQSFIPFYISGDKPSNMGKVIGKEGYGLKSFNGEHVILKLNGELSVGSRYAVFENRGSLSSFFNFISTDGYEIQIKGEIKILNYIDGTDGLYKAKVIKSLDGVAMGDLISSDSALTFKLSQRGITGQGNGKIIGSPNPNKKMISIYEIVYLNKGRSDGIKVNDIYYIRAKSDKVLEKYSKRSHGYRQPNIGQLRIIHADLNISTAIITEAKDQIYIDDFFSGSKGSIFDLEKSKSYESDIKEDLKKEGMEDFEQDFERIEDEEEEEDLLEEEREELEDEEEEQEEIEDEEEEEEEDASNPEDNIKDIEQEFKDLEDLEEIEEF
ncbi:MAG: LysM peptidoglycan-binding domain-containing protein [Bdellovibrionales bacterium]